MPGFVVVIPARLASTRLPRKPLADLAGIPMVVRVAQRAAQSGAERVVVATDSDEVAETCRRYDVTAVLTQAEHPTGTDRLAEAVASLELADDAIVVNVQGDEPLLPALVVAQVAELLEQRPDCAIATAAHPILDAAEFFSPHVVKVVTDAGGRALLFSRAPIPWARDAFTVSREHLPHDLQAWRHVGIYAYRVSFLRQFPQLAPAPIETQENLEQLRALWHGFGIAVLPLDLPLPPGVDTPDDLEHVRSLLKTQG